MMNSMKTILGLAFVLSVVRGIEGATEVPCDTEDACRARAAEISVGVSNDVGEYFYVGDYSNIGGYGCFGMNGKAFWGEGEADGVELDQNASNNIEGGDLTNAQSQKEQPQEQLTEIFDWDDSFSFSSGVISFYWSLDKPLDDLNTHNVFLSTKSRSQAEASWQVLRDPQPGSDIGNGDSDSDSDAPFNFYVHRPSKSDPSAAPCGRDTIMVLVPCRTLLREEECANLPKSEAIERYQKQFSPEVVSQIRKAVLKRFAMIESLVDMEDHIIHEEYRTPSTWADRYNLAAGTPFALSHGFAQLSITRPGPKSSGLPNVLYCGASTRPGNGVPLVLIGAKQVAEKAIQSLCSSE